MNRKQLLQAISRGPNIINYWLLRMNQNAKMIYGNDYHEMLSNYQSIDWHSLLLKSVNNAINNVPYYQNLYSNKNIDSFLIWAVLGVIIGGRTGYVIFYQFNVFFL